MALVLLFSAVAVWSLPAYAGEDLDALFIAADLPSGCTPRLVAPPCRIRCIVGFVGKRALVTVVSCPTNPRKELEYS